MIDKKTTILLICVCIIGMGLSCFALHLWIENNKEIEAFKTSIKEKEKAIEVKKTENKQLTEGLKNFGNEAAKESAKQLHSLKTGVPVVKDTTDSYKSETIKNFKGYE